MPLRYWYHCHKCNYRAYRYRNVKRCPDCGSNLIREEGEKLLCEGMVDIVETWGTLDAPARPVFTV